MMPATLSSTTIGAHSPLRILVADDNEMLRVAVRGLLQRLGHSVDVVTNGREAVEAASREDFDLLLLDVQMPEMDGFEAARSLRHRLGGGRRPRIIGVSGEGAERESCAAAGMDDFLIKPFRLADLVRVIKHYGPS